MKIGYFIGHFPYMDRVNDINYTKEYAHGGTEIAAYYLAVEMAKRNHKVDIFTTSIGSKDSFELLENMNIHRYGTNFRIASANVALNLVFKPLKHELEIVHAHSPIPYSDLPALLYAKRKKVPFVLTYQYDGQETVGSFIRNAGVSVYNKYLLNKVLDYANVIIATTKSYADESKFLRPYKDKITLIPNGINIKDFQISYSKEKCRSKLGLSADKNVILFLGSLVPYKGPDILLNAFSRVNKEIPNAELVFAGRGEMQVELEKLSKRLNIEKNVKFAGFIEEDLKPFYYKAADIFCLPSTNMGESFGIVNLEAMACGIPIISSKLGGIPDVVNDMENGILVKPGDPESLADALIFLLENKDIRKKMGTDGRKKVEEYSWEKIAEKTENIYNRLLESV